MNGFSTLPHIPSISIKPVAIDIPQSSIDKLHCTLKDADPIPETYETLGVPSHDVGVTGSWMNQAIDEWSTRFEWRKWEKKFNAFPQFKAEVEWQGRQIGVHFFALYSERKDAQPLIMVHGWPGEYSFASLATDDLFQAPSSSLSAPWNIFQHSTLPLPYHITSSFPLFPVSQVFPTDRPKI